MNAGVFCTLLFTPLLEVVQPSHPQELFALLKQAAESNLKEDLVHAG